MNKPGEIEPLARMICGCSINNCNWQSSLGSFGDIAGIAHEKAQIVKGLKVEGLRY